MRQQGLSGRTTHAAVRARDSRSTANNAAKEIKGVMGSGDMNRGVINHSKAILEYDLSNHMTIFAFATFWHQCWLL